jgi:large subunit ribosomal protein L25
MKTIELNVSKRSTIGKNEARRERATGKIPAVLYGSKKPTIPISVDRKALTDAFRGGGSENAIFLLKLAGTDQARHVMIKELQQDPVSRKALHIDFVRIEMTEKIRVKVSVEVVGVAEGVKNEGGILDFVTREIEIECLPGNIPEHIPVDVTALAIGDAIRVSGLAPLEGVTVVDDPEKVVVHVTHPTAEKEPEVAAAEAAAEITEPEVLKKGKVVTEEEGEEKEKEKEKEKKDKDKKEKEK